MEGGCNPSAAYKVFGHFRILEIGIGSMPPSGWPTLVDWSNFKGPYLSVLLHKGTEFFLQLLSSHIMLTVTALEMKRTFPK